jgi:hypothetical protein
MAVVKKSEEKPRLIIFRKRRASNVVENFRTVYLAAQFCNGRG